MRICHVFASIAARESDFPASSLSGMVLTGPHSVGPRSVARSSGHPEAQDSRWMKANEAGCVASTETTDQLASASEPVADLLWSLSLSAPSETFASSATLTALVAQTISTG